MNYFLRTGSTGRQSLDLQHLVKSRLLLLSAQAKGLFEVVAVAGQPVQIGIAVSAAELQSGGYAEITLLRTQRLIRILTAGSVEQIEIYHDRLREISNASMSADARREKHYRLAMAWEAFGQRDVRALARHFYDAAVPGKAFPLPFRRVIRRWELWPSITQPGFIRWPLLLSRQIIPISFLCAPKSAMR